MWYDDIDHTPSRFSEFGWTQDVVGVAQAPKLQRVAQVYGCDIVESLPLRHRVLDNGEGVIEWWYDAPLNVF